MSNEIPEDPYRIIARERSHDEAKESVATNRMLVQSLILINGGAAASALAFYGAHDLHAPGKQALPLVIILYCLGICIAVFARLVPKANKSRMVHFLGTRVLLRDAGTGKSDRSTPASGDDK